MRGNNKMSDTETNDFREFFAEYQRKLDAYMQERAEYLNALASYGITEVDVYFNGCGDSGQIDDITADEGIDLKGTNVREEHKHLLDAGGTFGYDHESESLYTLIEAFAYKMLNCTNEDWWNNDGGWGSVHIEPRNEVVQVEMNIRSTDYTSYEFSIPHLEETTSA
jgi:hypothetical protein